MSAYPLSAKISAPPQRMKIVENRPYSLYGWLSKAMNNGANRAHSLV
ncbi:hypothetical protein ABH916_001788 [Peribacillus frigoritolerans]